MHFLGDNVLELSRAHTAAMAAHVGDVGASRFQFLVLLLSSGCASVAALCHVSSPGGI